ncbi:MAG: hypothetical protein AAGH41_01930 [Pseudomonadota bacterium]
MTTALIGLIAFTLAGLIAYGLCLVAVKARFGLDRVSERSNHAVPTPRTGGVMILVSLTAAVFALMPAGLVEREAFALLGLTAFAGGIGIIDDFIPLPPSFKLAAQFVLAVLASIMLGPISAVPIPFVGWMDIPSLAGMALAVFWIVSLMNVVNFMDGLHGLVGTFAIVAIAAVLNIAGGAFWPLLATQGAVLGFLFCNVFRGRIFLGDTGSLAIGFMIAAAPLLAGDGTQGFWVMPLIALPLIVDVALTLVRRARRGANLTQAHREHLYQRLRAQGWSHQAVALSVASSVLIAYVLVLAMGPFANLSASFYWIGAGLIILAWASVMALMGITKPSAPNTLERPLR